MAISTLINILSLYISVQSPLKCNIDFEIKSHGFKSNTECVVYLVYLLNNEWTLYLNI